MRLDLRPHPVLRLIVAGVACAVLVALAGGLVERARFGADDRAAFGRVEREVQAEFHRMAATLDRAATAEARSAAGFLAAPPTDDQLARLFLQATALVNAPDGARLAVTLYAAQGVNMAPVAWAGRPSELPLDRLMGPSALFVAPGPLGVRLVRTEPVRAGPGAGRLGTVAAERVFSEHTAVGDTVREQFTFDTSLAVVSLRARYEGAGERLDEYSFLVRAPDGEPLLEARVDPEELRAARTAFRRGVLDLVVASVGFVLLLGCGPLLDRRALTRRWRTVVLATLGAVALIGVARAVFWMASPARGTRLFSPALYQSPALGPLLRHPADFLVTGFACLALVVLVAGVLERCRLGLRGARRRPFGSLRVGLSFVVMQLGVGLLLALAVIGYERFLADTFHRSSVGLLYFSPQPWNAARMAMAFGLIAFHATFAWLAVLCLRMALAPWRYRDGPGLAAVAAAWAVPIALALRWAAGQRVPMAGAAAMCGVLCLAALIAPRGLGRLRRASQGFRLVVMFVALFAPAVLVYPSLVALDDTARRRSVETQYGPEILQQRRSLGERLTTAQREIDGRQADLEAFVSVPTPPLGSGPTPESAFLTWRDTALERHRVSSAIELYNAAGALVSRFALNLPEETAGQRWREESCSWQGPFGEISPFGAQERQLLHAGRNICGPAGEVLGTIVIHVILDDSALSFISSQNPYYELLRGERAQPREEAPGREMAFVVYGWSRTPLYVARGRAWPIDEALFRRIYDSRTPFWARIVTGGGDYEVYFENDRRAIYALGYPTIPPIGHAINLAELMTLVGLLYVAILAGAALFRISGARRVRSGRSLLREVRESFYRKLFLAFVAASIIPVVTLALVTRAYMADRLRQNVESAADKTTAIARRVIEEYSVPLGPGSQSSLNDDAMIGLSRIIGEDVNVFNGSHLAATSERDLFASGLLPTRTPSAVYRAIALQRLPSLITEEQAGAFRYMVAAAPVRVGGREAILTVPLTLRQREIEREIDALNRRIVLAAMLFILVGAAFGYPLAERIADPVSRLMRATRRIARGDFDARIATTASDELRRLVEAFNMMSSELRRQREELERTHRLEAWAEMARQVAHEIKNPLTPIQLNAEHLRRVHTDRGKPLGAVLEGCVEAILSQVRLLRQIASEFSSFASSPTARLSRTDLAELVAEVIRPYQSGASETVRFEVEVEAGLPPLTIDRTLVGRALTNVIDNALHAMPGGGLLRLSAQRAGADSVEVVVEDTGVGMDQEALSRLFEPYFSTKAVGTGLGLAIARRNVELNAGTILVDSERGKGTRVRIVLPVERAT